MFITNPLYSSIDLHIRKVNQLGDLKTDCKTYAKQNGNRVTFICFNLISDVVMNSNLSSSLILTSSSLVVEQMKYSGKLVFTFDKTTNEVYVSELPVYDSKNRQIPVFTRDMASIVVDKLKGYVSSEDISIRFFSSLSVFAIDNGVVRVIPSIKNTKNYCLVQKIVERISLEEQRIMKEVLHLKAKQDREERARQRAISKKRMIMGINPIDYESVEQFYRALDNRKCFLCDKRIANFERHLQANISKYKKMIIDSDPNFKCVLYCLADEKIYDIKSSSDDESREKIIENYLDAVLLHDLTFVLPLFKKTLEDLRMDRKTERIRCFNSVLDKLQRHPLFHSECNIYNVLWYIRAMDLLYNIEALKKQIAYYQGMWVSPSKLVSDFSDVKDSWGLKLTLPYWIRIERDMYSTVKIRNIRNIDEKRKKWMERELFYLLMIKPGVSKIDFEKIRIFADNDGDKFGKRRTDIITALSNINISNIACDRLMVTIPSSLELCQIYSLIDFANKNAHHVNFVCETVDVATLVKRIIILRDLELQKNGKKYFNGKYFVNVDPTYFDSFFVDTPTNKEFWHRYDYLSTYRYHRRDFRDLGATIDECIQKYLESKYSYEQLEAIYKFKGQEKRVSFSEDEWYTIADDLLGDYSTDKTVIDGVFNEIDVLGYHYRSKIDFNEDRRDILDLQILYRELIDRQDYHANPFSQSDIEEIKAEDQARREKTLRLSKGIKRKIEDEDEGFPF